MSFLIIGSSQISEYHIECIKFENIKIYGIASSRLKSNSSLILSKKYKIQRYENWKTMIRVEKKAKAILIASKVEVTAKILKECVKLNRYIFVEKPLSYSAKSLAFLESFSNKIFVLYNRRFYQTTNYLKDYFKKKKNIFTEIIITESNKKKLIKNGSHIIDLINYIFNDQIHNFQLMFKLSNSKYLKIMLKDKKNNFISLFVYYNAPLNTSVNLYYKDYLYQLKPIENLNIYKGMKIIKENNKTKLKKYTPLNIKNINDYNNLKFKPGFYMQTLSMINVIKHNKVDKKLCNVITAINNIKFINKIVT